MSCHIPTKKLDAGVIQYAIHYAQNRGIRPAFPRLVVGMMRELDGWPVRNADGGANVAYFETADAAELAITSAKRTFRETFGKSWSADD